MGDKRISNCDAIDAALKLDGDPDQVKSFYEDWAETYNADTSDAEWIGPGIVARLLHQFLPETDARLLDAGCGTGFVGVELKGLGYGHIDGFDLSAPMAEHAVATGAYRDVLGDIDMMRAGEHYEAESYDAVLSAGVFTLGHVPPEGLQVLLQLVRPGGLLVVSTRTHYYDQTHYQQVVDDLVAAGRMEQLHAIENATYNNDGEGHYWVYRRLS
jgi:predicted TPR repeat methyltransferase